MDPVGLLETHTPSVNGLLPLSACSLNAIEYTAISFSVEAEMLRTGKEGRWRRLLRTVNRRRRLVQLVLRAARDDERLVDRFRRRRLDNQFHDEMSSLSHHEDEWIGAQIAPLTGGVEAAHHDLPVRLVGVVRLCRE